MEKQRSLNKRLIAVIAALVLIIMALAFFLFFRQGDTTINDDDTPRIGYASEAKVMLDEDSLQAAVDAALENAENGRVALRYKNHAYSSDGESFSCHIINDSNNLYDMFLTIYTDSGLTDQIFLSGLVPPGSGFESITLDRALESGDYTVYVAVTQVDTDEETGEQVMKNQVVHTMEFHVAQ